MIMAGVALAVAAAACGSSSSNTTSDTGGSGTTTVDTSPVGAGGTVDLVAYSTPQAAYQQIEAAFQKTNAGKGVTFTDSYGASGDQSRAVAAGQPADYVAFALEPDITRLVKAGIVAADWNSNQYKGMVTDSVVVFVVRKGNPKKIKTWDDLTKAGIEVITPNPFTSGGARWNVLAAYGAQLAQGKTEDQATQYLTDLFSHVPVQDDSARKALETFTGGKGDVMLAYENEAIFAQHNGVDVDYVVPDQTILIENPIAVSAKATNPAAATAFAQFVLTKTAQKLFADNGYRPVVKGVVPDGTFPTPKALFDITKFGGWDAATKKFFDPAGSIMATIEQGLGVATSK
jgi:sulfate transport system substrate-binding protein